MASQDEGVKNSTIPMAPPLMSSDNSDEIRLTQREDKPDQNIVMNALTLSWCFGHNKHINVLNLCVNDSKKIFLASSHIGVVYNFETNSQILLQGHKNSVSCCTISDDKRWLVTADAGADSTIIIWDLNSNMPVQTYFNTHLDGTISVAITPDSKYIASLSAQSPQVLAIWEWTTDSETPVCTAELEEKFGLQNHIRFNLEDTNQLVTNSSFQTIFYEWSYDNGFVYHAPILNDNTFKKPVGQLTQSVFQSNSNRALTATTLGNLVVWQTIDIKNATESNKKALKLFKLQEKSINCLILLNDLIVIGDSDGQVKFIDQKLHILMWFKHFNLGPVNSLSFSHLTKEFKYEFNQEVADNDATLAYNKFLCKDFIVSTTSSVIAFIKNSGSNVQIISRSSDNCINSLACHPSLPRICFGNYSGYIQLWNYDEKSLTATRNFNKSSQITCLSFDPLGNNIAVGFKNGHLQIIDAITLEDCLKAPFTYSKAEITHIEFSDDAYFLATAESDFTVSVYKYNYTEKNDEKIATEMYTFLGRYRSHYKPIVSLLFGVNPDTEQSRLLSLGKDRVLVEYDLEKSSYDELIIKEKIRIEQYATPLGMIWYPPINKETFLLTVNDQWKYKMYNSTTKMCRKTLLGPTYGSFIKKMTLLPSDGSIMENRYMAYINENKLGLQKFPLTGNPFDSISIFAHPDGVTNLSYSFDGKYLFTTGGENNNLFMWNANYKALDAQSVFGGADLKPFYGLIDGGREGEFFKEMKQLFYYSQLRHHGINENTERVIKLTIPLSEIPYVMRGLGFYPTEQEIEDMINEVKFSEYVDTNKLVETINLDDFIKLYINHRPAFGLDPYEIYNAFNTLSRKYNNQTYDLQSIPRHVFLSELQKRGEHMTDYELAECLSDLLYLNEPVDEMSKDEMGKLIDSHLAEDITVDSFMSDLIGIPTEHFNEILNTWQTIKETNTSPSERATSANKVQ